MPQQSNATLQQQIQQIVAEAIVSGHCAANEKMPSSRKLADFLGVSRITVTLAYSELVSNGYLVSRNRSGYFVSSTAPTLPVFSNAQVSEKKGVDWDHKLARRPQSRGDILRPPNWTDYKYPFIYGQSDPDLFDHQNWRNCALRAVGRKDFDTLTHDHYQNDDPMLVEYILRYILPRRGIRANSDEILITLGGQNALWMIAQLLLSEGQRAIVENPCYPGLRKIFDQMRYVATSIDVDDEGLPPDLIPPTPTSSLQLPATTPLPT